MSSADEILALIGKPDDMSPEREAAVLAMIDRLVAAILAEDEPTAVATLSELHDRDPEIAHRLFVAAFEHVEEEIVVFMVELNPERPGDDRGTE